MNNYKKLNILIVLLGVINFICGFMHIAFEYSLLFNNALYREFLLIENILIAFIFIYFAIYIFKGNQKERLFVLRMNICFWMIFIILVLVFQPEVTSLNIIKNLLIVPQRYILLLSGICALILSLLNFRIIKKEAQL